MADKVERRRNRMDVAEELIHWLNATDTSEMTMQKFRSVLHQKLMDIR